VSNPCHYIMLSSEKGRFRPSLAPNPHTPLLRTCRQLTSYICGCFAACVRTNCRYASRHEFRHLRTNLPRPRPCPSRAIE
jgi:hypothetical protein